MNNNSHSNRSAKQGYLSPTEALDEQRFRAYLKNFGGSREFIELCVQHRAAIATNFDRRSTLSATSEFDAIVAYSFDYGPYIPGMERFQYEEQFDPAIHQAGDANREIGRIIANLLREQEVAVFCQLEITVALSELNVTVPYHRTAIPTYHGEYLSTKGVAENAAMSGLFDFNNVVVVAHPHHVTRCIGATRRAIADRRNSGNVDSPEFLTPDLSSVPYPEEGFQHWPRSKDTYQPLEIAARLIALREKWLEFDDLDDRHF